MTFVAGAALAVSAYFVGREFVAVDSVSIADKSTSADVKSLVARVGDLEARIDALARTAAPAAVRSEDTAAVKGAEARGAATAAPADANAQPNSRFAGFDDLRKLRDAPDDKTKLELARAMLADSNPMTQMTALRVVADLAPKEALATVDKWVAAEAKGDMSAWQVDRAIATLADSKGAAELGTDLDAKLNAWYQSGADDLKRSTARSLESRGQPGPMQSLVASYRGDLGNADVGVRTRAVDLLGNTRSPQAVAVLTPMLSDSSEEVKLTTLDALRRTGSVSVIDQLLPLLNDPVAAVRDRATRTIESLRRGDQQQQTDWTGFGAGGFGGRGTRGGGAPGGRRGSN